MHLPRYHALRPKTGRDLAGRGGEDRHLGHSVMSNKRSQRIRSNRLGRNDPCPCGSGRKYKKYHGELAQGRQSPGNITEALEAHKAKESLRKHQQGKGKPIISTEFAGQRVVAVGSTAYFAKNQRTFVDFLGDYIKRALGSDWGTAEIKKPLEDRHQILQWYDALCAYQGSTLQDQKVISRSTR